MIVFGHFDDKYLCIKEQLNTYKIESDAVKAKHPVLAPFYIAKLLLQRKRIKVFIFRYVNDSNSFFLATMRVISEGVMILLLKIFKIEIWWLCHNIDKETSMFFPKLIEVRRRNIVRSSSRIFTTNELLIPKAREIFPESFIDSLSLGYIEKGFLNIKKDDRREMQIKAWIEKRRNVNSKFIFCIGSPANKSIHFKLVNNLIEKLNIDSRFKWYAIVIGDRVVESECIYNVPHKLAVDKEFIKNNADFYYRVMDDYSMSYSIFEAAHLKIPIITEEFGIMPQIIRKYNLGVVISDYDLLTEIENYSQDEALFLEFLNDNNWGVAAKKIKTYYDGLNNSL